ncbi:hypothetical protein EDC04DRAFT_2609891 [Pisolithus marmoratus]|nr:hypothetical protein EDC04DRAFT_2609891 [Pisolithus marmoratus]
MATCEAHTKLYNTLVLISQVRWGAISNRQQLMRSVTRHEAMLYSLRVPRPKVVTRMADAIRKADDDAIELPAKRSVARSFSINHFHLGGFPSAKQEGDSPGPPPKKRAIKSPSTCHTQIHFEGYPKYANYCRTFLVVSYLAAVGFKLPIAGWLDVNEAGCVALPVWRHIAFRAVDVMWFTSLRTLSRHQLGAMCAFFDSLQDMQVVHKVYFHLYHDPSCIPAALALS